MDTRDQEKAKNAEVKALLTKAVALLPGFSVVPEKDDEPGWDCGVEALNKDGVRLWCKFSAGYGDKRIHASGVYPRNCKGEYITVYYTNEEREARKTAGIADYMYGQVQAPKISISAEKTPEKLAKDISSRLLPDVLDMHARVMARIKADNEYHGTSEATLAEVRREFNKAPLRKSEIEQKAFSEYIKKGPSEYGSRIHVKTSRECVTLEINDITASEAIMIIRSLKELRNTK